MKRQGVAKWIKNSNPTLCCLPETPLNKLEQKQNQSQRLENNSSSKQSFQKGQKGQHSHFLRTKKYGYEVAITLLKINATDEGPTKLLKLVPVDFKKDFGSSIIVAGDVHTILKKPNTHFLSGSHGIFSRYATCWVKKHTPSKSRNRNSICYLFRP